MANGDYTTKRQCFIISSEASVFDLLYCLHHLRYNNGYPTGNNWGNDWSEVEWKTDCEDEEHMLIYIPDFAQPACMLLKRLFFDLNDRKSISIVVLESLGKLNTLRVEDADGVKILLVNEK